MPWASPRPTAVRPRSCGRRWTAATVPRPTKTEAANRLSGRGGRCRRNSCSRHRRAKGAFCFSATISNPNTRNVCVKRRPRLPATIHGRRVCQDRPTGSAGVPVRDGIGAPPIPGAREGGMKCVQRPHARAASPPPGSLGAVPHALRRTGGRRNSPDYCQSADRPHPQRRREHQRPPRPGDGRRHLRQAPPRPVPGRRPKPGSGRAARHRSAGQAPTRAVPWTS